MLRILVLLITCCQFVYAAPVRVIAENFSPLHFINEQGVADGALVELTQLVLKQAELSGIVEIVPQARALQLAQSRPDVILMSLLRTPERESEFCWLGESYATPAYLMARADLSIDEKTLSPDLHSVATIRGYYSETYLKSLGFTETKNLVLVLDDRALWQALLKGRSQFILTNTLQLENKLLSYGIDKQAVKKGLLLPDFPNHLYFASTHSCQSPNQIKFQQALLQLKKNGQYQAIIDKWQLDQ